ncbi:MAG: carbohydrate ABC transporter permease [Planctomycetota bacterium]|jgi:ABC-type glycerol-3-phosphate transport system permease component
MSPLPERSSSGGARDFVNRHRAIIGRFALLAVLGLGVSVPFFWMLSSSFKPRDEVESLRIFPEKPTARNYPMVLDIEPDPETDKKLGMRYGRWYYNSVFVAIGVTLLQVLTSAMAAYAFSRIKWRGRDQVFILYLATMMIPGVVTMIPNFQIMVWLGFVNTYRGLIIPAAFSAFGTFLLRQFMLSIPPSLDEAAKIDGASHWQIFWDVIMPLARPGLIALGIFTFMGAYKSFFWPLIMLSSKELFPLSVGLLTLDSTYGQMTELIMAAAVMAVAPLVIIFVVFQKFLVKGLQLGGVKG